jgi:signal transduction histidine kinase
VQDYGRGIDPKFHKRIFDRFFQTGNGASGKLGLGIGLFIASTIVKAHEGKIWVESTLKKGSTFYFSLPVNGES